MWGSYLSKVDACEMRCAPELRAGRLRVSVPYGAHCIIMLMEPRYRDRKGAWYF